MSQFDRMCIFAQVVKNNGFSAAARELKLTTATVSKQISVLEEEMNLQLLRRTTRKIELTEEGRPFFERCEQLLRDYRVALDLAGTLNTEPAGPLRVLATRYFGEQFIVPYLGSFLSKYPKIQLKLDLAERIPNLFEEKIDVFFGISLQGSADWIQKTIGKTRYVCCASPKYIERFGMPERSGDLLKHRVIAHSMRKPVNVIAFSHSHSQAVSPYLILNDTQAMLRCALDGVGIVRLHEYLVSDFIKKRKLAEILPQFSKVEFPVYVYYQPSPYVPTKIRKFIEYFSEKVRLDS